MQKNLYKKRLTKKSKNVISQKRLKSPMQKMLNFNVFNDCIDLVKFNDFNDYNVNIKGVLCVELLQSNYRIYLKKTRLQRLIRLSFCDNVAIPIKRLSTITLRLWPIENKCYKSCLLLDLCI
jgi:hypothetical protein